MKKFLLRTLLVLVVLIGLCLIIALFMDKSYHVERSIAINKPTSEVFDYVKHLKNQDEYAVWNNMDKNMKKSYKGEDGTVGFVAAWDSKKDDVGAGEQEITKIVDGQRLDCDLRFKRPMESTAKAYFTTNSAGENATTVEWGIDGECAWPFNFMMLFWDMDAMMGKDLDQGLKNMKKELESENY